MDQIKAIIFDLDNTILNRTRTFEGFTQSLLKTYFSHLETTDNISQRIIELDQDGYKDKPLLFHELLQELPWSVYPPHDELMEFYGKEYVRSAGSGAAAPKQISNRINHQWQNRYTVWQNQSAWNSR